MSSSLQLRTWALPREAFHAAFDEMRNSGRRGVEGIALWLGRNNGGAITITHTIALRGSGILKRRDYINISPELLNEVGDVAAAHEVFLVGQIHSHATSYGTWLSEADKRYGIAIPGYLSAVAPDFALRADTRLNECGIHVFESQVWNRLDDEEIAERLRLTDGAHSLVVVGDQ